METFDNIRLINKREAEILFKALHHWFFKVVYKKPLTKEMIEINQLYQDLKGFVQNDEY